MKHLPSTSHLPGRSRDREAARNVCVACDGVTAAGSEAYGSERAVTLVTAPAGAFTAARGLVDVLRANVIARFSSHLVAVGEVEDGLYRQLIDDAAHLYAVWGGALGPLGWTDRLVFGDGPLTDGLISALRGRRVVRLSRDHALLSDGTIYWNPNQEAQHDAP